MNLKVATICTNILKSQPLVPSEPQTTDVKIETGEGCTVKRETGEECVVKLEAAFLGIPLLGDFNYSHSRLC